MKNHRMFCLVSSLVWSMLVLNLGYVQAQTPSRIAIFDPNGAAGACNNGLAIDCVDSNIFQAPDGTIVTSGAIGDVSLQIGALFDPAFTLRPTDGTPNAGYIRFGDNTGWKLHIGRNREVSAGPPNTGLTGVLMTVQDNGNVGIGTTTPPSKLEVVTGDETLAAIHAVSAGGAPLNPGLRVDGSALTTGYLCVDYGFFGPCNFAGAIYSLRLGGVNRNGKGISSGWDTFSSRRWKTNIQTIQGALEKVERLRGVSFDWKEKGGHDIGLIAEEVAEVIP